VRERKVREFDPTVAMLRDCVAHPAFSKQQEGAQKRMRDTLALMEALSAWTDEMLALETATLARVAKLGAKVQTLLRRKP
jgi:DNA-binding transcriptional regulator GbsR (MarR family)